MAQYYVDGLNGDDGNPGTSEALAKKTISAGLALLSPGDTLNIKNTIVYSGLNSLPATPTTGSDRFYVRGYNNTIGDGGKFRVDASAGNYGIETVAGSNTPWEISDVEVYDAIQDGVILRGSSVLRDAIVHGCSRYGISGDTGTMAERVESYGNAYGIRGANDTVHMRDCHIHDNTLYGLLGQFDVTDSLIIDNAPGQTYSNQIRREGHLRNCTVGNTDRANGGTYLIECPTGISISNCIFYNSPYALFSFSSRTAYDRDHNLYYLIDTIGKDTVGVSPGDFNTIGPNSLNGVDPQFIDLVDFEIPLASPAFGTGINGGTMGYFTPDSSTCVAQLAACQTALQECQQGQAGATGDVKEAVHAFYVTKTILTSKLSTFQFTSGIDSPAIFTTHRLPDTASYPAMLIRQVETDFDFGTQAKRGGDVFLDIFVYTDKEFNNEVIREIAMIAWQLIDRQHLSAYLGDYRDWGVNAEPPRETTDEDGFPAYVIRTRIRILEA